MERRLTRAAGSGPASGGRAVYIREAGPADEAVFIEASRKSVKLHSPWTTAPSNPRDYRSYLGRLAPPVAYGFLVFQKDSDELVGCINLSNIVLGVFRSGYLGFYAFSGHEGQGLMSAGLRLVVRRAFTVLKLHRLEANVQPSNLPSLRMIRACGFEKEGYSPKYLKIGGRWRDHERWAIVAE